MNILSEMNRIIERQLKPNREQFAQDPFGYAASAWHKWAFAQEVSGFPVDMEAGPTGNDFKSPVLWLAQAHAMQEAAVRVIRSDPNLDHMPNLLKGLCDAQYCAVGLMLVGYSLEICLKGMVIVKLGMDEFVATEKRYYHHKLERLADFVPNLSEKDRAILRALTHFVVWAGRYPDPGSGREDNADEIFRLSETYEISARDLFDLAGRVMKFTQKVLDHKQTSNGVSR